MNEVFYWIIEYVKVLAAFMLIMYVWPMVVFHKFLKGKSRTFKFGFCTVSMISIVNTVVILLGLMHVLNEWVVRILFYGAFLVSIMMMVRIRKESVNRLKYSVTGTMGRRTFTRSIFATIGEWTRKGFKKLKAFMGDNSVVYIMLILVIMYMMLYITWNAFQNYSYGASDMSVHHRWIYGLVEGDPYVAGIYPEGMHCFVYAIHAIFGIEIYSALLFVAGINIAITFVSAYLLFKEMFRWKYAPVLTLVLFAVLDAKGVYSVLSMSRLAWTIPQEFGLPMVFLCGAFLIRYLKNLDVKNKKIYDDNLLIFILALAGTITVHFYVTIMAFFICLMAIVPFVHKVFRPKTFAKLAASVLLGVFIAFVPMLIALAGGKKFQGSIFWAINYMKDSMSYNNTIDIDEVESDAIELAYKGLESISSNTAALTFGQNAKTLSRAKRRSSDVTIHKQNRVFEDTYSFVFGNKRGKEILVSQIIVILLWGIFRIAGIFIKHNNEDFKADAYDGYLIIALLGVCFALLNGTAAFGLPQIFELGRLNAVTQLLGVAIFFIPVDLIMSFGFIPAKMVLHSVVSVVVMVATVFVTIASGNYHGYLYYSMGRYNGAVKCTVSITEDVWPEYFTIVSPTDELYQLIEYGYHEEVVDFINSTTHEDSYVLPTHYVFIFVEKKPLKYQHYHFASGPKWLALEKYPAYYGDNVSQEPNVISGELNEDYMTYQYPKFSGSTNKIYLDLNTRIILESKLYAWCQQFDEEYPDVLHTYYEDDDFVCYYFRQNPRNNYELSFK